MNNNLEKAREILRTEFICNSMTRNKYISGVRIKEEQTKATQRADLFFDLLIKGLEENDKHI